MCQVANGWRLRLPLRDWVVFHFTLQGEGTLRLGSGETYALSPNSLAVIPPGLVHSVECGSDVRNESVVDGQGDVPPICDLIAGPEKDSELKIACGRVQISYAGSLGGDVLRFLSKKKRCMVPQAQTRPRHGDRKGEPYIMGKVLPSQRLLKQFEEQLVFGEMNLSETVGSSDDASICVEARGDGGVGSKLL